ncbi:hypothetical protein SAMN04487851_114111 [Prevotella sp. tc2-28]|uniref:hypothetical protein n=1 Tax=Prevotella sp. tc2-28 TaxID=1761888 RepID=UPI000895217B|nr:hypothetical protein [Prevotella sp. tc2-28]SEA80920.1 hypothetical protein SAMN04487851_114111 [Prevotella sp. tc2-28]
MAKAFGSTRIVQPSAAGKAANLADFNARMATGQYDPSNSSISAVSGAYVAYMTGHEYHIEEMEAAKALSDAGFNVVLTPEGPGYEIYATNMQKGKFSEGTVSQITYEQTTPKSIKDEAKVTVKNAIVHANKKHSEIALIYDRHNLFHRKDIEDGMKHYQSITPKWEFKAKVVLVVNSKGEVYEHQFDK